MKKHVLVYFSLMLTVLLSVEAWSEPRTDSYRTRATGGMFKNNYDRLSDNPAYVGAKRVFPEYTKVASSGETKVDDTTTADLFTTLDGLNSDNRFLLGTIADLGFMGIGGYAELGFINSPSTLDDSRSIGNTNVTLSGSGEGEASDVVYSGSGTTGPYTSMETLIVKEKNYSKYNNINAKLAAGGLEVGPMIMGISFERKTEIDGISSSKLTSKGGYNYTNLRLADSFTVESLKNSYDYTTENTLAGYYGDLGFVFPLDSSIESVELTLGFGYLQYKQETDNRYTNVDIFTGASTTNYSTNNTITDKQDGMEFGVTLLTREKIFDWSTSTYVSWMYGGINPYSDRKAVSKSSNDTDYFGSTIVNTTASTTTDKYSGDGIARNKISAGIITRKEVVKGLLVGFGLNYSIDLSTNEYSLDKNYTYTRIYNNGDGADTAADYTCVTSGSYTDRITEETATQTITFPIGIEYQATSSLSWRLGAIHTTTIKDTSTSHSLKNINEPFNDYDYAHIAGNESDYDAKYDSTSGSYPGLDTNARDRIVKSNSSLMSNSFYIGLGYDIEKTVMLDVVLQASTSEVYDARSIRASATYSF